MEIRNSFAALGKHLPATTDFSYQHKAPGTKCGPLSGSSYKKWMLPSSIKTSLQVETSEKNRESPRLVFGSNVLQTINRTKEMGGAICATGFSCFGRSVTGCWLKTNVSEFGSSQLRSTGRGVDLGKSGSNNRKIDH